MTRTILWLSEGDQSKVKREIKQKATATALHAKDIVNEGRKLIELGLRIKYEVKLFLYVRREANV